MANYRLDSSQHRYQEDYQDNRQTLNQRRQPTRQRTSGNYRLDANGQPIMRPNQDRSPRPARTLAEPTRASEFEPVGTSSDVYPSRRQRSAGNHRLRPGEAPRTRVERAAYDAQADYDAYVHTGTSQPARRPRGNYRQRPYQDSMNGPSPDFEALGYAPEGLPSQQHATQARWPKGKMKLFSVFVVLVLGLVVVGYQLLPTHYVNAVQVVGNQRVDGGAIAQASGIQDWERVKDVMGRRKSIEQAIMQENPLVSKVTVRRPNMQSVQLEVEEHAIVAKVKTGDGWLPVLDNGTWGDFSASVAQNEAVNLDQLPELLVQGPSGRLTELTTMLKQTPAEVLGQIESLKLGAEERKTSAFEAKMKDGNLVKAVLPTFNYKMGFYDQMVTELEGKKGTLNLEVGAYFTPYTGQQRPVRVQSGQQP